MHAHKRLKHQPLMYNGDSKEICQTHWRRENGTWRREWSYEVVGNYEVVGRAEIEIPQLNIYIGEKEEFLIYENALP